MQKPSERNKLTSDNNIIKCKKPVHNPLNELTAHWLIFNIFTLKHYFWNDLFLEYSLQQQQKKCCFIREVLDNTAQQVLSSLQHF